MRISRLSVLVLVVAAAALLASPLFVQFAQSPMTYYTFEIRVPDEVKANPGDTVEVQGEILVTGFFWLHKFELNASGIPSDYDYKVEPSWWQDVRILRDWNPQKGVFRVPEKFNITIDIPTNAVGAHLVTITGQEHHSFREVLNETYFILTIGGAPAQLNLSVEDIVVPETVKEFEPFDLTFKIKNTGPLDTATTISVLIPEDWDVDNTSLTLQVKAGATQSGAFKITPTTTAGTISLLVEYPFKGKIINFTKVGPYLVPGEEKPTTTTTLRQPFYAPIANFIYSIGSPLVKAFERAAGAYSLPITVGVIIVLVVIIVWILTGMFKFVRTKGRGEPEKMAEQAESMAEPSETAGVEVTEV